MRLTAANAQRLVRALARYGYGQGEFEEADFTTAPNFLSFAVGGGWVDLMTQVLGVSFDECLADSLQLQFADVPMRYIGLPALRATGHPQDLCDLDMPA